MIRSAFALPALGLLAVTAACSPRSEPRPRDRSAGSAAPALGDAGLDAPRDAAAVKQRMLEHFAAASELQRALVRGRLDDARRDAQALIDEEPPPRDGWRPFVDEMRAAARAVLAAKDVPAAAALAADLGRACSRCHEAYAAIVTFPWEPAPDDGPRLATQMKRHQWASARLWEGLVGPSDEMWAEATSVLAVATLDAAQISGGPPSGEIAGLAANVRALARRAGTLTDHEARATLYGELLASCTGCHQRARPVPVPDP